MKTARNRPAARERRAECQQSGFPGTRRMPAKRPAGTLAAHFQANRHHAPGSPTLCGAYAGTRKMPTTAPRLRLVAIPAVRMLASSGSAGSAGRLADAGSASSGSASSAGRRKAAALPILYPTRKRSPEALPRLALRRGAAFLTHSLTHGGPDFGPVCRILPTLRAPDGWPNVRHRASRHPASRIGPKWRFQANGHHAPGSPKPCGRMPERGKCPPRPPDCR